MTNSMAKGDMTVRINVRTNDEIGQLLNAMNDMVSKISNIIEDVRQSSHALTIASIQVNKTAQSLLSDANE
ncbi:MAG: HAMP domain-containing protein [Gammaproteobacteria bacterium]|nr:HAMP domain-containing protein [Gammaproteobacteria bacterium]